MKKTDVVPSLLGQTMKHENTISIIVWLCSEIIIDDSVVYRRELKPNLAGDGVGVKLWMHQKNV